MTCNCHSYNWAIGEKPEIILEIPDFVQDEALRINPTAGVCVDACIAATVKALWDRGVVTLGSCCGHGRMAPSLVLGDNEDCDAVASALVDVDPRPWELWQWRDEVNEIRVSLHICDACKAAASFCLWGDARAAGWIFTTIASGDAAKLCPECIPHE